MNAARNHGDFRLSAAVSPGSSGDCEVPCARRQGLGATCHCRHRRAATGVRRHFIFGPPTVDSLIVYDLDRYSGLYSGRSELIDVRAAVVSRVDTVIVLRAGIRRQQLRRADLELSVDRAPLDGARLAHWYTSSSAVTTRPAWPPGSVQQERESSEFQRFAIRNSSGALLDKRRHDGSGLGIGWASPTHWSSSTLVDTAYCLCALEALMATVEVNSSRPGLTVGPTSEFSLFFQVKPGEAESLRAALRTTAGHSWISARRLRHHHSVDP